MLSPRVHLHPMVTIPEPPHTNPFSWALNAINISDMDYMMTSGLDALMMTKFHYTCFKILACCAVYGVFVLCPVHNDGKNLDIDNNDCFAKYANYSRDPDHNDPPDCTISSIYTKLTMANIDVQPGDHPNPLVWYDIFGAYLFTALCMYFFTVAWDDYTKMRHLWLSKPCTENQTVVVDHIPLHLRSNHALYTFFDGLFPGQVASVAIVLDVKGLDTLISLRDKTAIELDYALATRAKTGKRPTFIFHNWKSRLEGAKNMLLCRSYQGRHYLAEP